MNAIDTTICRLCIEDGEKKTMMPLIDECLVLTPTGEAVSNFLDTKIKTDDNLPSQICKKCLVLLNQSIQFKQRCQTNYETLKSWAKNLLSKGADENDIANILIQHAKDNRHIKKTTEENTSTIIKKGNSVFKFDSHETKNIVEKKIVPKTNSELLKRLTNNIGKDKNKIKPKKSKDENLQLNSSRQNSFICEHCGKDFTAKATLEIHLVGVHQDYTKCTVYSCKLCPYKSAKNLNVVIHTRSHTGERPFVCEKCGQAFFRKCILRMHRLKHQEKNIACNYCESKFHTVGNLKAHINNAHIRQYLYQCYMCEKTYAKIGTVRKHLVKIHKVARESQTKVKRVFIALAEGKTGV